MTPDPIQSLDDAQALQRARECLQRSYAYSGLGDVIFGVIYVGLGAYTFFNAKAVLPVWTFYWIGGMVLHNLAVNRIDGSRKANGLTTDRWPLGMTEAPHVLALNRGATAMAWICIALFVVLIASSFAGLATILGPYRYELLIALLVAKTVEGLRRILTTHLWEYGFEIAGILAAGYCYEALVNSRGGILPFIGIFVCFGAGSLLTGLCLHARWNSWVNELERDEAGKDRNELHGA